MSSRGRGPIAVLVAYTQWSPRRLIAAFRMYAGLPPSTIAGLNRFEHAGYADQSHLIRDFAKFAGCRPTAYLRERLAIGGGVVTLAAD